MASRAAEEGAEGVGILILTSVSLCFGCIVFVILGISTTVAAEPRRDERKKSVFPSPQLLTGH